jgi:hypothetical protein
MLLPARHNKHKNKKGLSIVIGYVLLMAVSISMSILVYQFLKTYVPKDAVTCPEGTSLFIKSADCSGGTLTLILKNNGKFSLDGYFIHGSTNPDTLATIDLVPLVTGYDDGDKSIAFTQGVENGFNPGDNPNADLFQGTKINGLKKIEIIPIRQQTVDNFKRPVSCSDAKVETGVNC